MNISSYRDFPLEQIIFETPTRSKDNTYISEAFLRNNEGENEKVIIQTPGLLNVNGIVRTGNRAHIELAIDREHSDFYDFISNLDRNSMDVIEKNSETWFGQKFPKQIIEDFYRSVLKPGREQTTPCVKLNLPVDGDEILVDFLNKDKKKCFYSEVPANTKTVVVMQFIGLRFLKQQVLSIWKPIQVLINDTIVKKEQNIYIQDNLLSDEEQQVEAAEPVEEAAKPVEEAAKPVEEAAKPVEEAAEPVEEAAEPIEVNVLEEAPKEENTALTISELNENMEHSENPPNYEEVKNLLEHTEVVQPQEQQLLESLDLELDEVPMGEEPVVSAPKETENEIVVEEEIPTLTDEMLDTLEVESEEEASEEEEEEEEEESGDESTIEEYREAFQYLEGELEKRDEVIKTLKRQMSGMLSALENVEDEQN